MTKNQNNVMKMHVQTIVDMATTTLKKVNTLEEQSGMTMFTNELLLKES
jgi:hypothetical protein